MKKIIAYPVSIIHYILLAQLLVIFHLLQVIAFNLFGYKAHKFIVDTLNGMLILNLFSLLSFPSFSGFKKLPKNGPLIIISNHQSMYDIPPVVWGFRKHHTKFISKKELGKNLPSISYNLQKGGSVLIDRTNGSQSIKEILKLGKRMENENWSACIFPEGTRTKTGKVKRFQAAGVKTLLKASPNALIVPLVIDGNFNIHKWGKFPLNFGLRLKYTALPPISRNEFSDDELIDEVRERIVKALDNKKLN